MLREVLRDNIDELLFAIQKIGRGFILIRGKEIDSADILELKRRIHSLKGGLQAIGMEDEAAIAIELEEAIFRFLNTAQGTTLFVSSQEVDDWFTRLNAIEFSLKGYLF